LPIYVDGEEVWSGAFSNHVADNGEGIYLFNTDNCDGCGTVAHDGMPGSYGKIRVHDGVLTAPQVLANFLEEAPDCFAAAPTGILALIDPDSASIDFGVIGTGTSPTVNVTIKNISGAFDLDLVSVLIDNAVFQHDLVDLSTLTPGEERHRGGVAHGELRSVCTGIDDLRRR
jgi:hypothetical protein